MKTVPNLLLVFILWLALILGCASSNSTKKPSILRAADAYKTLTSNSTYNDVVQAMGRPDKEIVAVPPDAQLPNVAMAYLSCRCIVFVYFTKAPKKATDKAAYDKKFTRYMGVKGVSPNKTLHVSDEKYRILLDSLTN
jgi:hypothetical protein